MADAGTLALGALIGITQALGGAAPVPAGTAAARPPVQPEITILGLPSKMVVIGLVIVLGVLLFIRMKK